MKDKDMGSQGEEKTMQEKLEKRIFWRCTKQLQNSNTQKSSQNK